MPTTQTVHSPEAPERDLPIHQILVGDALDQLDRLPTSSIDTAITSPPYYRLRDYNVEGQLGLEASLQDYIDRLVKVLTEVGRVLKPTGSLWLNLGDTYARRTADGAERKSLVLTPEKVLLALAERGWIVRSKVVWAKPNPMPSSVKDRLSCSWEPLYLLTRSEHYFFNLDAIRLPHRSPSAKPAQREPGGKYLTAPGSRPAWAGPLAGSNSGLQALKRDGRPGHPGGKNPTDVWTIPTSAFRGAHFATFPEALVERPLLATCPERVCRTCGTPWWPTPGELRANRWTPGALRKSCPCPDPAWEPGIVLDPFIGSGTVALVANRLHRRWVGIELHPDYAALARTRLRGRNERRD